jgi:predicted nuclease with TOPRIM domain
MLDGLRKTPGAEWHCHYLAAKVDADQLRAKLADAEYQLAEEKNATANDRDPSYHEERLRSENSALAMQLVEAKAECNRLRRHTSELEGGLELAEAKLAEAEKRARAWKRAAKKFFDSDYWIVPVPHELRKRAEAAEARVKQLEALLKERA